MARLRALDPWLWPPLVMALIFALSAQPNLSSGLGILDLIGRKLAHAAIYGLLCATLWRALAGRTAGLRGAVAAAVVISVAYAVTDEWHQSFVAGRSASVIDVAIDALGAVGAGALRLRRSRRQEAAGPSAAPRP